MTISLQTISIIRRAMTVPPLSGSASRCRAEAKCREFGDSLWPGVIGTSDDSRDAGATLALSEFPASPRHGGAIFSCMPEARLGFGEWRCRVAKPAPRRDLRQSR